MKRLGLRDAEGIAIAIVKEKFENLKQEKRNLIFQTLKAYIEERIPEEIKTLYNKYPGYFVNKSFCYPSCAGMRLDIVFLTKSENPNDSYYYPCDDNSQHPACVEMGRSDFDKIDNWNKEIKELKETEKETISKIAATLKSLGTLKKIKESLPEVVEFLPAWFISENTTTVALPLDEVKFLIKKYS